MKGTVQKLKNEKKKKKRNNNHRWYKNTFLGRACIDTIKFIVNGFLIFNVCLCDFLIHAIKN